MGTMTLQKNYKKRNNKKILLNIVCLSSFSGYPEFKKRSFVCFYYLLILCLCRTLMYIKLLFMKEPGTPL